MKNLFCTCLLILSIPFAAASAATPASDTTADSAYDADWTDASNGGTGFGPWQLTAAEAGGYFTGSSSGNAGGGSGGIDTSGRSWGLWASTGVTEAIRTFDGTLATSQIFSVDFDNGYVATDRSAGMGLQNSAGENLFEFYFYGGESRYSIQDGNGSKTAPMNYTGDGFTLEVEVTGTDTYRARLTESSGNERWFLGSLISQTDQGIAQVRFWNYEAGTNSNSDFFLNSLSISEGSLEPPTVSGPFPIVDTGQTACYGDAADITPPAPGETYAGQDAQYAGLSPSFTLSADGLTVLDNRTGLTWRRSPDLDDDGDIDVDDKLSWSEVQTYAAALNSGNYGGHSDWRIPSIKEQYSLIDFRGTDPNVEGTDTTGLIPFIDTGFFDFAYGDTDAGERVIDSQYASTNLYVAGDLLFGVNFADGRIKGYGLTAFGGGDKTFLVVACRGNTDYGKNDFTDNGDGTIGDVATGLTWQQDDSLVGMNWADALAYAESLELGGYKDWRLPNVKELQGLMDYSRSPDTTSSAAIDALFPCSSITNMGGVLDYPFYWSGTTHLGFDGNAGRACYASFGRGLGTMDEGVTIIDIHGAGCQRSDPKDGDEADYPDAGNGPQGDVSRVFNHVRCVRGGIATPPSTDTDGDGLSDWDEYSYSDSVTGLPAEGDLDNDGYSNISEIAAGTSPSDVSSYLGIETFDYSSSTDRIISWQSVLGKTYRVQQTTNLMTHGFETTVISGVTATPPLNTYTATVPEGLTAFYRIETE